MSAMSASYRSEQERKTAAELTILVCAAVSGRPTYRLAFVALVRRVLRAAVGGQIGQRSARTEFAPSAGVAALRTLRAARASAFVVDLLERAPFAELDRDLHAVGPRDFAASEAVAAVRGARGAGVDAGGGDLTAAAAAVAGRRVATQARARVATAVVARALVFIPEAVATVLPEGTVATKYWFQSLSLPPAWR